MPSQATSPPPLAVTVLAALWVSLGRYGASEAPGPGCDSGKLSLDRDLLTDAFHWDCAVSTWSEPTQKLPSIDTVYDPEPARQICVDTPISYKHTIPNSGAYRPVRAESGEYLYCPPQRWLNNLHHGALVLLYHPCAPPLERHLLTGLARSCLPDYILTPHPQLRPDMPIALVSWGHTLELPTVNSSAVCNWLETTQTTRHKIEGVAETREYNLLLTWPARRHRLERAIKTKETLRRCCERTISSLLSTEKGPSEQMKEEGNSRRIRAATGEKEDSRHTTATTSQTNRAIHRRTRDVQNHSSTTPAPSADSPPERRTLSDASNSKGTPQFKIQNQVQTTRTPLRPHISETLKTDGLGLGPSQSQKGRPMLQTPALQPSHEQSDLRDPHPSAGIHVAPDGVNIKQNLTTALEGRTPSPKDEGTGSIKEKDSNKHSEKANDSEERNVDKGHVTDGKTKDNEVVDVKEREVDSSKMQSAARSDHKTISKSKPESRMQQNQQAAGRSHADGRDCDSCRAGEQCDCSKASGAEARAALVNTGLPRTPRTDEAVWAAAALGFLLVLLTLSVLHTRLYRHWRTMPSLYWHDPQQDYDSVADVIRRRLRIAKRRRKRSRRQECVLLPSSSSSDELP
ncbi:uncharacterized protein tp53i13 [Mugil cephalus]|uniref:uncharacterized protein tp53i13 n=1 Tax=Mugil cephalus TaxID=48193 RepID=UPI001FB70A60|nr:uncharacterized protein tp53i13 [Mugil cephalus]